MFPTEPLEQDVLFTANRLLRDAMDCEAAALPQASGRAGVEFSFKRQREAALLHRNGRLRAIQALHRPGK